MSRTGFLACAAVPLFAALMALAAADDKAIETDLAAMQGEWLMESGSADGYPVPDAMRRGFKRVCKSDQVTVTNGEQVVMRAKITIDPAKTPKTIDYEVIDGPTKGKRHLGIYELDGAKLKSCFGAPDMKRPTTFDSKVGDRTTSSVWKRATKE